MSSDQNKAVLYSSLLALQFGLQPLISTRFTSLAVSRPSIVIGTELGKILIAVLSIAFESSATKQTIRATWTLKDSLYYAAVPAVLYAIQNVLVQIGYTLVDSMTFNLLNQTKVNVMKMALVDAENANSSLYSRLYLRLSGCMSCSGKNNHLFKYSLYFYYLPQVSCSSSYSLSVSIDILQVSIDFTPL